MRLLPPAGLASFLALLAPVAVAAAVCPDNVVWDGSGNEVLSTCEDAGTHLLTWSSAECIFFGTSRAYFDRAAGWDDEIVAGEGFAVASASAGGSNCSRARIRVALNTLYTVQGPASSLTNVTVRVQADLEVRHGEGSCCGTAEATLSAFGTDTSLQLDTTGTATEVFELNSSVQAGSTFVVSLEAFAEAYPEEGWSISAINVVEILTDPGFTLEQCEECTAVATPSPSMSQMKGRW